MDPKAQFLFLLLAFICFLVSAVWNWEAPAWRRPNLLSLGLAFWVLVPLWTAWKAI